MLIDKVLINKNPTFCNKIKNSCHGRNKFLYSVTDILDTSCTSFNVYRKKNISHNSPRKNLGMSHGNVS